MPGIESSNPAATALANEEVVGSIVLIQGAVDVRVTVVGKTNQYWGRNDSFKRRNDTTIASNATTAMDAAAAITSQLKNT